MAKKTKLRVIPLGGLDEIGKNITVFEYGEDIIVVDCGIAFPDDEMLGVDLVIPDFSYLEKNVNKIRGIVITHGHEDHIGALPFLLKKLNVPIYGTRFTIGLIEHKLKEHNLLSQAKLNRVKHGDIIKFGAMSVEYIRSNHSIVDASVLAIHTPVGVLIHTGDFKIDSTPIEGEMIDLPRIGELGKKGVLALFSDSTNAERPGYTMSEKKVGYKFGEIFKNTNKRILVATFASNIHRVQQVINAAVKYGRKVALSGRSMENVVEVAITLGYMNIPDGTLIKLDDINKYKPHQLVIVTTGSQGEPMSALSRIAFSDHRKIEMTKDDLVIISASPIPGNEKTISRVIDELFRHGVEVMYESLADLHVSGHACQEELKMMLALAKPKYFIPVHGEYRHLKKHAILGIDMGVDPKNVFLMDIGKVLEFDENHKAKLNGSVGAGKVLVDGLGVGDVGNIVLRDRKHLSEDGLIVVVVTISSQTKAVVAGPDIISRGFVYVREAEDLMGEFRIIAKKSLDDCVKKNVTDWATLKSALKNTLSQYIYEKTKRNPMILPVIMEV